ncbi:transcription factor TFIIIC subunit tfc4 [Coemansia sp. RSA 552]|nr:transcription factor TFIIIC subunit tfc4 [Coemansia sp. RSA 552]
MDEGGSELGFLPDNTFFSDDVGGDAEDGTGMDDSTALMAAVRSATEMLAAEGLGNMVNIDTIQRQQHLQPMPSELEYMTDDYMTEGYLTEGYLTEGDNDYLSEAPEPPQPPLQPPSERPTRNVQRVRYDEATSDVGEEFIPEGLLEDDDSVYGGSSGEGSSSDNDEHELKVIEDAMRTNAGFKRSRRKKQPPQQKQGNKPGMRRRRRKKSMPRKPTYSAEVGRLLGQANGLYVEQRLGPAFDVFCEVIREDASCAEAWNSMGLIREEQGKYGDALHLHTVAAHLTPSDISKWERLYMMHMNIAEGARGKPEMKAVFEEAIKQALYSLRQIIKSDQHCHSAWKRRLKILEDLEEYRAMAGVFRVMLRNNPHNMETIRDASKLHAKHLNDLEKPVYWFTEAMVFYNQQAEDLTDRAVQHPNGAADQEDEGDEEEAEIDSEWAVHYKNHPTQTVPVEYLDGYNYNDLHMLAELRLLRREYETAIIDIKRGARYIQGRGREAQWAGREMEDECDAEYSLGDDVNSEMGNILPVELRVRLGQARLMLGQEETAKRHIDPLFEMDTAEYEDMFADLGETYAEIGHNEQAIEIYQMLMGCEQTNQPSVWERLAKCYRDQGDLQNACQYALQVVDADPSDVDMQLWLAEVYEEMGEVHLAYKIISTVEDIQNSERLADQMNDASLAAAAAAAAAATEAGGASGHAEDAEHALPQQQYTVPTSIVAVPGRKPSERGSRRQRDAEEERSRGLAAMRNAEIGFKKLDLLKSQLDKMTEESQRHRHTIKKYCAAAQRMYNDWRHMRSFYLADRGRPFQKFHNAVLTHLENDAQEGNVDLQTNASGQAAVQRQLDRIKRRLSRKQQQQQPGEEEEEEEEGDSACLRTFRGIVFERWFDMFLLYGKYLAVDGQSEEALSMLDRVFQSNVFIAQPDRKRILRLVMLSIAIYSGAYDRLYELARWWCGTHPSRAMVYKLFAFTMATSMPAASMLTSTNVYKYVRRQLEQVDPIYYAKEEESPMTVAQALAPLERIEHLDTADSSTRVIATLPVNNRDISAQDLSALHTLAAHVMLVSRYGGASIAQYTAALALSPRDPSLALHMGVAYLGRTTRNESTSTQATAIRGMAYIQRYAELRYIQEMEAGGKRVDVAALGNVVVTQEIAYNYARAFHFLGQLESACRYYLKVFELPISLNSTTGNDSYARSRSDLRREAAYNLANIYTASGAVLRARALLREYCTIE